MRLQSISLRLLIIGLLTLIIMVSVVHTLVSKQQFREATVKFRTQSVSRLIEVARHEVLSQTRTKALAMGSTLQKRLPALSSPDLVHALDDPFINGFVGVSEMDLVKLRVYDLNLRSIASSNKGLHDIPTGLPDFLHEQAMNRKGIERLKALGGLWLADKRALYSLLLPVGDLEVRGYLEVVFNPVFNLRAVGEMIQMPFSIHDADDHDIFRPELNVEDNPNYFQVKYPIPDSSGKTVLILVAYDDLNKLDDDLSHTQLASTALFFALTILSLLIVLWLLNRYLFRPVHLMLDSMEHSLRGELSTIDTNAIREIHIAARAFNTMARKVAESISELQRLSSQDGLTGIANRRHFDKILEEEWHRAARESTSITLILIDIDFFKQYNDLYGHQAGDQCLKDIAQCLELVVQRPADLVARYGGEEFVVLLPNTESNGAINVAKRLQKHVAKLQLAHAASKVDANITLSLGVATYSPAPSEDSRLLLRAADTALYRAKKEGRNRIAMADFS